MKRVGFGIRWEQGPGQGKLTETGRAMQCTPLGD